MPLNTTVVDRDVEHPNRIQLTLIEGTTDTYDLTPVPGSVVQAGTAVNASLLNSAGIEIQTPAANAITAPADADVLPVVQTATLKKITWANIKATLKTYFDGLYAPISVLTANLATSAVTAPKLATNATVDRGKFVVSGCVVSAGSGLAINVTAGVADFNEYHGATLSVITNQAVAWSSTLYVFLRFTIADGTTSVVTNASFTGLTDDTTYKYLPIAKITTTTSVTAVVPVYSWAIGTTVDLGSVITSAFSQSCTLNTYYDLGSGSLTTFIPYRNARAKLSASTALASSASAGVVIWLSIREGTSTQVAQISTQAPVSACLNPMTLADVGYDLTAGTTYAFKVSVAHSVTNTLAQQSAGTYFGGFMLDR